MSASFTFAAAAFGGPLDVFAAAAFGGPLDCRAPFRRWLLAEIEA